MPDICDLILDEHESFRRLFSELDELRAKDAQPDALARVWGPLAAKLELHAAAEEEVFYPELLRRGTEAEEETTDAIKDHNEIRDAVAAAASAEAGSDSWWEAVASARESNSDHMAEEERGAIADLRSHTDDDSRFELGSGWLDYERAHPGGSGADTSDKDPDSFVARNSP